MGRGEPVYKHQLHLREIIPMIAQHCVGENLCTVYVKYTVITTAGLLHWWQ